MGHWGNKANQYLLNNPYQEKKEMKKNGVKKRLPSKWDVFLDSIEIKIRKIFGEK